MIFDHWGNFKFFEEEFEEIDRPPVESILTKLFKQRISLAKTSFEKSHAFGFDLAVELMGSDINDLPMSSISVKEKIRFVEEMKVQSVLKSFSSSVQNILFKEISPLMKWRVLREIDAIKFDLLMAEMQSAVIKKSAELESLKIDLFERLHKLAVNINYVRSKDNLIKEIQTAGFWQGVEISQLEYVSPSFPRIMIKVLKLQNFKK